MMKFVYLSDNNPNLLTPIQRNFYVKRHLIVVVDQPASFHLQVYERIKPDQFELSIATHQQ